MCRTLGTPHPRQEAEPGAPHISQSPAPVYSTGASGVEILSRTQAEKGGHPLRVTCGRPALGSPNQPQARGGSFAPGPALALISFLPSLP